MTKSGVFIYTGALLPDGQVLVKANMRDSAKARDKLMVVAPGDPLYDEALTHAVSYVTLQDKGDLEIKARLCQSQSLNELETATRRKILVAEGDALHSKFTAMLGPFTPGKPVWLDLPRDLA